MTSFAKESKKLIPIKIPKRDKIIFLKDTPERNHAQFTSSRTTNIHPQTIPPKGGRGEKSREKIPHTGKPSGGFIGPGGRGGKWGGGGR